MTIDSSNLHIRQATLPSIGERGLNKLRTSTVAVVGAGGVGSAAAYFLARSGVGTLRLIDQDIVEPSNLQRIHSAAEKDLFHPKAEVVARAITNFDSRAKTEPIVETITDRNCGKMLEGADMVVDGLDNFRTRYILNRFAIRTKTPYLFASAIADQANLALLHPPNTPCLACIIGETKDRFANSCESLGVTPTITGLAGSIAAGMTVRYLLGNRNKISTRLITVDMEGPEFLAQEVAKRSDCSSCSNLSLAESYVDGTMSLLCGEHTANALPPRYVDLNLPTLLHSLPAERVLTNSDTVLVYLSEGHTISLFRNGRLLISNIDDEALAAQIAKDVWAQVGVTGQGSNFPNREK